MLIGQGRQVFHSVKDDVEEKCIKINLKANLIDRFCLLHIIELEKNK